MKSESMILLGLASYSLSESFSSANVPCLVFYLFFNFIFRKCASMSKGGGFTFHFSIELLFWRKLLFLRPDDYTEGMKMLEL
jgi:hypothetical protein